MQGSATTWNYAERVDREVEDGTLFNSEEPGGKYRLDMSVPYDKVVGMELIQVATLGFLPVQ